jgi:nicotinamidase-related amidase
MERGERRDWSPFALLLIDLQRDSWSDRLAEHFTAFGDKVADLVTMARCEGIELVHLRATFEPDQSDWMPRYRLRGRVPYVAGTPGCKVLPYAAEEGAEQVFLKHTFDGFLCPDLLPYLRQRHKRFILTAGLLTATCVLFTTISAAQLGFLTAVVEDCCADHPAWHQQTLDTYQFVFDRTTVPALSSDYDRWRADLERLSSPAAPHRTQT